MLKEYQLTEIKKLRTRGFSISEISNTLNIPKSTVQRYTKDTKIKEEYFELWKSKRGGSALKKNYLQEAMTYEGRKTINRMSKNAKLILLSALYWGEGNKKDLMITNSDPGIIKIFVELSEELFLVNKKDIQVSLRIFEDMNMEKCKMHWSAIIGIDSRLIHSITILAGKKSGKLKYGMCRVRIRKGGMILARIRGINHALSQKYINKQYNHHESL